MMPVGSSFRPVGASWRKLTVGFAALATAATTNNITLFTLQPKEIIHSVRIKHSASFTGGVISAYTISVGIAGTLAKYAAAFDVFQAAAATTFQLSTTQGMESETGAVAIKIAAVSTGANTVAATAGSVDVWVLTSRLP